MNRSNYDPKIIATYDIAGSFFIDIFYNDLYLKAKAAFNNGEKASLTDAYRDNIMSYAKGIERKDLYMGVVKKLIAYYRIKTGFSSLTFIDFEDDFLSKFIPKEYYKDFSNDNKDQTLRDVVVDTVHKLSQAILKANILKKIIDYHNDLSNISLLQDVIVDILCTQREIYYSKFSTRILKDKEKVDISILNKVKGALKQETEKRVGAEAERDKAIAMIRSLVASLNEQKANNIKLESTINANKTEMMKQRALLDQRETISNNNQRIIEEQVRQRVAAAIADYERSYETRRTKDKIDSLPIRDSSININSLSSNEQAIDPPSDNDLSNKHDIQTSIYDNIDDDTKEPAVVTKEADDIEEFVLEFD